MKRVRVAPGKFVTISAEMAEKAARVLATGLTRDQVRELKAADLAVQCSTNHYAVTAQVEGLVGMGLTLRNNAADDLSVRANGAVTFPSPVSADAGYAVTVQHQPTSPSQTCSVVDGVGTSGPTSANIDNVRVVCATRSFTVGGQTTGLQGTGLILRNNGGDDVVPDASGRFQFHTPVASGGRYAVTVRTQPVDPSQTCTVNAGTEAGPVTDADIGSVTVACATNSYKVGGRVSGLWSATLGLQLNGAENIEVHADGSFEFTRALASGSTYQVTVVGQPRRPMMNCVVTDGSGTISSADVASPLVRCTPAGGDTAYDMSYLPSYGGDLSLLNVDSSTGLFSSATGSGAYVSSTSRNNVVGPSFAANGLLAFMAGLSAPTVFDGSVDMVQLDAQTGRMTLLASDFVLSSGPTAVIAHPSGQFVYTPTRAGKIRVYKAEVEAKKLTQTSEISSTLWQGNRGFVDAPGRFLYVQSAEGVIAVFRISPTDGSLTFVQTFTVTNGAPPSMRMRLHQSGKFIYVLLGGEPGREWWNALVTLAVDGETGMLSRAGSTSDLGVNSANFALHPSGRFLYVHNWGRFSNGTAAPTVSGSITVMAIDGSTGVLTRVQPDIDNGFTGGSCISAEPSGKYLYADVYLPNSSQELRVFQVDLATGKPTLVRQVSGVLKCPAYREAG